MSIYLTILFVICFSYLLITICKKKMILMNSNGNRHQEFVGNTQTPLIGGIILFISLFLFNYDKIGLFLFFMAGIFFIGLFSDLKKFNSPIYRFLIQILLIVICVYFLNLNLLITRVNFLDYLLKNYIFSIIFTSFCILIIINGSNFIDGINTLVIGYYLIICCALIYLQHNGLIVSFFFPLDLLTICLVCLLVFNSFNKLFLGDSGAYLLGFLFSVELINLYLQNLNITPFFIILLLWYPAFENLFSIFRKINFKKSPIFPDTNHLHQLIFSFFKSKKFSSTISNNLTGLMINFYNAIIVGISLINPFNTQFQIILIFFNLIVYTFFYMRLFKYR